MKIEFHPWYIVLTDDAELELAVGLTSAIVSLTAVESGVSQLSASNLQSPSLRRHSHTVIVSV